MLSDGQMGVGRGYPIWGSVLLVPPQSSCRTHRLWGVPWPWAGAGGIKLTAYSHWGQVNGKRTGWRCSVHTPRWECCRWTQGEMQVTGTMGKSTLGLERSWWPLVSVTTVGTTGKQKGFHWILYGVSGFVSFLFFGTCFRSIWGSQKAGRFQRRNVNVHHQYFTSFSCRVLNRQWNCQLQNGGFVGCSWWLGWVFPALSTETLKM